MNQSTYLFILLSEAPVFLRGRLQTILFFIGVLPAFCWAHDASDKEGVKVKIENIITNPQKGKIYIVEGTVTLNLENTSSAEIIAIPIQREVRKHKASSKESKEKKEETLVAKQVIEKEEKSQKSTILPVSDKEVFSLGQKNAFGISFPNHTSKKLAAYLFLNDYKEWYVLFYTTNYNTISEGLASYLAFSKQTTRPPPSI